MKSSLSHLITSMWKNFGLTPDRFMTSWLPLMILIQYRHYELYVKDHSKKAGPDSEDMNIDQVKAFFLQSGIKVKEEEESG